MKSTIILLGAAALLVSGCQTTSVNNTKSQSATRYVAFDQAQSQGINGIESQDIVSMTDKMVRDMLSYPIFANSSPVAVVIVDDKYFVNDSTQRLNKKLIVDRLRTELFRAAKGRIRFIARHASDMFEQEQQIRTAGVVGGTAQKQAEVSYRLTGSFKNQAVNVGRGQVQNYVQTSFEMVDLNTGELVWTNIYEFKKSGVEESPIYK